MHPAVALAYNQRGVLEYTRNQDDQAEADFRQALAIWRKVYGNQHQFVGLGYSQLASVYIDRKDYPTAEVMCRKALAIYAAVISENHINTATTHVKLGRILLRESRFQDAEAESMKGYRYLASHVEPTDSYLVGVRKDLFTIETRLGRPAQAAQFAAHVKSSSQPALH